MSYVLVVLCSLPAIARHETKAKVTLWGSYAPFHIAALVALAYNGSGANANNRSLVGEANEHALDANHRNLDRTYGQR